MSIAVKNWGSLIAGRRGVVARVLTTANALPRSTTTAFPHRPIAPWPEALRIHQPYRGALAEVEDGVELARCSTCVPHVGRKVSGRAQSTLANIPAPI